MVRIYSLWFPQTSRVNESLTYFSHSLDCHLLSQHHTDINYMVIYSRCTLTVKSPNLLAVIPGLCDREKIASLEAACVSIGKEGAVPLSLSFSPLLSVSLAITVGQYRLGE